MTSRRSGGLFLPLFLAGLGVLLIVIGQLPLDQSPVPSLAPIPTPSQVAETESATPATVEPSASPALTPIPENWTATQIQIDSVGINTAIQRLQPGEPLGDCCAYLLANTADPGHGTNAYIAGHALLPLMKGLWNVLLGAEVRILMSDGQVLRYAVTEVHPNVSCPDPDAEPMTPPIPLALLYAPPGCGEGARWTAPTDHERLTMQTSQGYNRNWGELVVIALPVH